MKLPILFLLLSQPPAATDTAVIAAALGRAREVVEEGRIQVSPGVGEDFWGVDERPARLGDTGLIEAAAERAGLAFGPDEDAMECPPPGGCRAVADFRGLVHVWDLQHVGEGEAVVRLRILAFTSRRGWIEEWVDDVFVRRGESGGPWVVVRVESVSVS